MIRGRVPRKYFEIMRIKCRLPNKEDRIKMKKYETNIQYVSELNHRQTKEGILFRGTVVHGIINNYEVSNSIISNRMSSVRLFFTLFTTLRILVHWNQTSQSIVNHFVERLHYKV